MHNCQAEPQHPPPKVPEFSFSGGLGTASTACALPLLLSATVARAKTSINEGRPSIVGTESGARAKTSITGAENGHRSLVHMLQLCPSISLKVQNMQPAGHRVAHAPPRNLIRTRKSPASLFLNSAAQKITVRNRYIGPTAHITLQLSAHGDQPVLPSAHPWRGPPPQGRSPPQGRPPPQGRSPPQGRYDLLGRSA